MSERHEPSLENKIEWILANQATQTLILKEILKMSETFAGDLSTLDTNVAALGTAVANLSSEVSTGLAANASAIAALQAQIAAGTPVTAAQLADLDANNTAVAAATANLTSATATLQAALNPPAGATGATGATGTTGP